MNNEEIKNHPAWKYISSLSNKERHSILFGSQKSLIEKEFGRKIEERSFTDLQKLSTEDLYISASDPFRNVAYIAVFI